MKSVHSVHSAQSAQSVQSVQSVTSTQSVQVSKMSQNIASDGISCLLQIFERSACSPLLQKMTRGRLSAFSAISTVSVISAVNKLMNLGKIHQVIETDGILSLIHI